VDRGEVVEDDAAAVPRPGCQRCIPADEVLVPAGDGMMVPRDRSGIGRRLGYSPLAHWRP
jgi:hypothetical protein